MAGKGGYQKPENPAMTSGPGALSQRTDGGPGRTPEQAARYISGRPYGEGKVLNAQEHAAPLAGSDVGATPSVPTGIEDLPSITPLTEPYDPSVPLTHGMPFGPGSNHSSGLPPVSIEYNPETKTMAPSNVIQSQYQNASNLLKSLAAAPDASPALQYLAQRIGQGF